MYGGLYWHRPLTFLPLPAQKQFINKIILLYNTGRTQKPLLVNASTHSFLWHLQGRVCGNCLISYMINFMIIFLNIFFRHPIITEGTTLSCTDPEILIRWSRQYRKISRNKKMHEEKCSYRKKQSVNIIELCTWTQLSIK